MAKNTTEEAFNVASLLENDDDVVDIVPTVKKRLILHSIRIDMFTVKRSRIVLTPSMCDTPGCNYDSASKFGGYDYAPKSEHSILLEVLAEHKKVAHNKSEEYIIYEDDLPSQWLGDAKKKRVTAFSNIGQNPTSTTRARQEHEKATSVLTF